MLVGEIKQKNSFKTDHTKVFRIGMYWISAVASPNSDCFFCKSSRVKLLPNLWPDFFYQSLSGCWQLQSN